MVVVEGQDIGFKLQLINQDNTYKTDAIVTYSVYASDSTAAEIISSKPTSWNNTLKVYYNYLDVSTDWINQTPGNYIIVWSLSNVTEYPSTLTEELTVIPRVDNIEKKIDNINVDNTSLLDITNLIKTDTEKILGLVHHNMLIDQTVFDEFGNMVSARIRLYKDSASVGSENNILTSYRISVDAENCGQFNTWEQAEE